MGGAGGIGGGGTGTRVGCAAAELGGGVVSAGGCAAPDAVDATDAVGATDGCGVGLASPAVDVVVGTDDEEFRPQTERTYRAAEAAGLDVHYRELPGGHSMQVWAPALEQEMDWLGERVGLLD